MSKMKRLVGILLVVFMLFSTATVTAAAGNSGKGDVSIQYVGMSSLTAGLSINSYGLASCSGSARLSNNTYSVYLTVVLERYSGGVWSQVTYWTASGSGYSGASIYQNYYVSSGTYRVRATAAVFDSFGNIVESGTTYSTTQSY